MHVVNVLQLSKHCLEHSRMSWLEHVISKKIYLVEEREIYLVDKTDITYILIISMVRDNLDKFSNFVATFKV